MSYANGIISVSGANDGVSIYDVQRCFGTSKNDVGDLIANVAINKWAKYKPVRSSSHDTVTGQWNASQHKWGANASWWKAGGSCGLEHQIFNNIGSITNTTSFLYKLVHGLLPWTYLRPQGGVSQVYRLQDFAQYFHDAVPAVGQLGGSGRTIYVPSSGSGMRQLTLNYDVPDDELNLTLADFEYNGVSFQDYYLAVVMLKQGTNTYLIASSVNKIGSTGSGQIDFEIGYSDVGTWKVIPFISSVNITAYGEQVTGNYLSAGYDGEDTIIIASAGTVYLIYASGVWSNTAYTQVGLNIVVENNNSSAKTFTGGLTVYIYETDDSATTGAAGQLVGSFTYSTTFTVQANSSYTIPETIHNQLLDMDFCGYVNNLTKREGKEYWVTARFTDGTTVDNQYEPVQDMMMPDL